MEYLKIPLDVSGLFEAGDGMIARCGEKESIDKYIELLLTTTPGEHSFDRNFGCRIWEMDFVNIESRERWEITFRKHIADAVARYEKRLAGIDVALTARDVVQQDVSAKVFSVRRRVDVTILGTMVSTGERCAFGYVLYLGPLPKK